MAFCILASVEEPFKSNRRVCRGRLKGSKVSLAMMNCTRRTKTYGKKTCQLIDGVDLRTFDSRDMGRLFLKERNAICSQIHRVSLMYQHLGLATEGLRLLCYR